MLKQSLVQEKLSDLINIDNSTKIISDDKLSEIKKTDLLPSQYNMPQWPRVQLDKQITSNLKHNSNSRPITNNHEPSVHNSTNSRFSNKSARSAKNSSQDKAGSSNMNEKVGFDGDETVNLYSKSGRQRSGGGDKGSESGRNRGGPISNGNNLNSSNQSGQNNNSNSLNYTSSQAGTNENNSYSNNSNSTLKSVEPGGEGSSPSAYDLTMKLRYLEKSIKFIQQQHSETLSSLHQEIEKLKNENRELHFKLATRKSSGKNMSQSGSRSNLDMERTSSTIVTTRITNLKSGNELKDPVLLKNFEKAMKDSGRESDLEKKLDRIKSAYDSSKYVELQTRLNDAESKNEYLSKVIAQLQSKNRAIASDYKLDAHSSSNNTFNNSMSTSVNNATNLLKLNLNNIYTIEPLRIKMHEYEEPRQPTLEESEVFISKLYDLYKHQKQQISNMKIVLKDVMQSENLSNQGMMMTKEVLENNSNKISQYLIDNTGGFQKFFTNPTKKQSSFKSAGNCSCSHNNQHPVSARSTYLNKTIHDLTNKYNKISICSVVNFPRSIVTPITRYAPQSGLTNRRYHSQFLATLASTNTPFNPIDVAASLQSVNEVSNIQLPPLQTINPVKFPDRQRRTQVLQKQRLRRDYFH